MHALRRREVQPLTQREQTRRHRTTEETGRNAQTTARLCRTYASGKQWRPPPISRFFGKTLDSPSP
jgi:hypothetical protein